MELFNRPEGFLGDANSQAHRYSEIMYQISERCIIHMEELRQQQREETTVERAAQLHTAVADFQQSSASYNESMQKLNQIEKRVEDGP